MAWESRSEAVIYGRALGFADFIVPFDFDAVSATD